MPELTPLERDLRQLEVDLRQLEVEYTMFFAGQRRRPPIETRNRVDAMFRRYDRAYIQGYADRYRFTTLQSRYHKFVELWDRGIRLREEGRGTSVRPPGPKREPAQAPAKAEQARPVDFSARIEDPTRDVEQIKVLHAKLVEAGEAVGQPAPPFAKFAQVVRVQMQKLQRAGASSVDFHVAVKEGKVSFSAKGVKDG